jgi:hypothetical protein
MSDGAMSTLLDFERVMDEADVYAFKNWLVGELVDGPVVGRYNCKCVFMWPYKLMPNPKGALRLANIGCKVTYGKGEIKVPVEVKDYRTFVQTFGEPSEKDLMMAKAYGGAPRGQPKRVVPKPQYQQRESNTPAGNINRNSNH